MESPRNELTGRQSVVLEFLKQYIKNNGIAPTVSDICRHFKLKSTNAAHQHLVALERKGYIDRGGRGQSRYIKIIDNDTLDNQLQSTLSSKLLNIKIIEKGDGVNPFSPFLMANSEMVLFLDDLSESSQFLAYKIQDDNLADLGIVANDVLIIVQTSLINNGDLYAYIANAYVNVELFNKSKAGSMTHSLTSQFTILGKVVKLIRTY